MNFQNSLTVFERIFRKNGVFGKPEDVFGRKLILRTGSYGDFCLNSQTFCLA